jgi:metallophosphoesterase (TIGR00282 family)
VGALGASHRPAADRDGAAGANEVETFVRILFVGDVVGKPGRRLVREILPGLLEREKADFTVVNVENAAGGFGISHDILEEMFRLGVDCLTSGNHIWDRREAEEILDREPRLLRPYNYPDAPGSGLRLARTGGGESVAVLNLQGRVFMPAIDCPFQAAEQALDEVAGRAKVILVDLHAEATSEKISMGWFLDGRVSAVLGTHTHVATADLTILPEGTAYLTDVGMTAAYDSVIGMEKDGAIRRLRTQRPVRWKVATGDPRLAAVALEVSEETGRCTAARQLLLAPDGSLWCSPAGGG